MVHCLLSISILFLQWPYWWIKLNAMRICNTACIKTLVFAIPRGTWHWCRLSSLCRGGCFRDFCLAFPTIMALIPWAKKPLWQFCHHTNYTSRDYRHNHKFGLQDCKTPGGGLVTACHGSPSLLLSLHQVGRGPDGVLCQLNLTAFKRSWFLLSISIVNLTKN